MSLKLQQRAQELPALRTGPFPCGIPRGQLEGEGAALWSRYGRGLRNTRRLQDHPISTDKMERRPAVSGRHWAEREWG